MSVTQQDGIQLVQTITLSELLETVSLMRVCSSPLDLIPTKFLLKVNKSARPKHYRLYKYRFCRISEMLT